MRSAIEKRHQAPEAAQDRLAAVVAEAEVDRLLAQDAVEHVIDRLGRPRRILRIAGDARFVQLHDVGFDQLELAAQHLGDVHRQPAASGSAVVQQRATACTGRSGELEGSA